MSKESNLSVADPVVIFAKVSKKSKVTIVVTFDFPVEGVEDDHAHDR